MLVVIVSLALAQTQGLPAERPPALDPAEGCVRWEGTATGGNDATVLFEFVLCGDDAVTGEMQWSSLVSGWNRREVLGTYSDDGARLELRDVRVVAEQPNPGWYFCEIDRYELVADGADTLRGQYTSSACNDAARFSLTRTGTAPAPALAPPVIPNQPLVPSASCGPCSTSGVVPGGVALWLALAGMRRRRPRCAR